MTPKNQNQFLRILSSPFTWIRHYWLRFHPSVIFLAFASPKDDLPRLRDESRQIYETLPRKSYVVTREISTTADDIFQVFSRYSEYIDIFHFAGHTDAYSLQVSDVNGETSHMLSEGIQKLLKDNQSIRLVFLNGCANEQQVEGLRKVGVPVIISTSRAVDDNVACGFATQFYKGLQSGQTVQTAFEKAEAKYNTHYPIDGPKRELYSQSKLKNMPQEDTSNWPWRINGSPRAKRWKLSRKRPSPLLWGLV